MVQSVNTQCPYCGVGCGLTVTPPATSGKATHRDSEGRPVWKVMGDRHHPSSLGKVCVKGATVTEAIHKNRLKKPMGRRSLTEPFRAISWEEAFQWIVEKIQPLHQRGASDRICMYGSGQFQTEDYYIAQKLLKGCLGTNNFDANSRLCMSSAVAGYIQSLGSDGPPCCYDDLELTDCAFIIGSNTADCHPIIFNRLRAHLKKNRHGKLIVVDPRETPTAKAADLHLAIAPGTDIDLLNGMAHLLLQWGKLDTVFIDECTQGFSEYVQLLRHYDPATVAAKCGITQEALTTAARYWGESQAVLSLWSMGINQSVEGTAKVRSLINLHLMTGDIGRPGAGPFSLTGQPNAMGGREAGGLAHLLPGYRLVQNATHRQELEQAWNLPPRSISPQPGRDAWQMITGLEQGEVDVLWIAATNPAVSMPDLERTKRALSQSPFTIYQDAYFPTETAHYAHLLLPAAQWGEKTGTMTNSERRVTLCPQFMNPPGQAKADWEIFAEVGRRLGFEKQFDFGDSEAVYREFVGITKNRLCDMGGLSHGLLAIAGPQQWPFPQGSLPDINGPMNTEGKSPGKKSPPTGIPGKRLYGDRRFATADGRARFGAFHSRGLGEPVDPDYPFVLTVGRLYGHWHTQTRTGRIPKITKLHPQAQLEIHPQDAIALHLRDGDQVRVTSRRGMAIFPVLITKAIRRGTVFAPMHWGFLWGENLEANALTHHQACPISKEPELKACAVQLTKIIDPDTMALLEAFIDHPQGQGDRLLPSSSDQG